jgi:MFS family permease
MLSANSAKVQRKKLSHSELANVIALHERFRTGKPGGVRAMLAFADLGGMAMAGANLTEAQSTRSGNGAVTVLQNTRSTTEHNPKVGFGVQYALTEALAVVHAESCYHRDSAPDNVILLNATGKPLLLDFGAARRVIGDMTQALTVILKPGYAPVEQYAEIPGMKQGPWTDVYALAAVVYFAIMGKTPLLALQVVSSPREWATIVALFIIVSMEGAINFTVPLYIQIVQGQSSIRSSIAMMPFMLTVFFTAILIVRLYSKFSPRRIAIASFVLVSIGTAWLAFVIRNEWSTVPVIAGLITVGLGQGALVTLLFNVLVTAAPKELAGDVGSLRGVTQNLAAAVGTALVGAFVVGMLSSLIMTNAATSPVISAELLNQVNPANLNFMTDTQVESRLTDIGASAAEVTDGLRINAEARIRALKIGFMVMSGLALLAIVPCSWLPDYKPGEIPADGQKRS